MAGDEVSAIQNMSYCYPAVGAFINGNDNFTSFTVWSPECKTMEVEVGAKRVPLEKDERGYWRASVGSAGPATNYRYRINGRQPRPDPASRSQPHGVHGPSAVLETNFEWSDDNWRGMALADMVIYELHVGTFTSEGTFEGVASRLDHFSDMGINAMELMPVAQFPGDRNWGYDGVFPFAVQNSYGGAAGLKRLVNLAHQSGIAVILDVVYNHLGPEGNYLEEFGPYFTGRYSTFWGRAINFDDAYCDAVRHFYWQNAQMWLEEFHVDGLRLDAVHAIWDSSARHFIEGLAERVKEIQARTGKHKVLIAEFDLNNPRYISSFERGGYGLDGQWTDEFHHALHGLVTGERQGYYEDFGGVRHLRKSLRDSYVYTGEYSRHRKRSFGASPSENPYSQFVVFSQNHDQVGNRPFGDRLAASLSFEALKLVAATCVLSPHIPMLFMGEEYGELNPFQYFTSHSDPELVKNIREGRRSEFSYFDWTEDVPDPQASTTFEQSRLSWSAAQDPRAATLLSYYKSLINLRKSRAALRAPERRTLTLYGDDDDKLICYDRVADNERLFIALNFSDQNRSIASPSNARLRKLFDSSSVEWNGPGDFEELVIRPQAAVVFELQ